jgi:DNA-directed RNA polymerase subunit K/omega
MSNYDAFTERYGIHLLVPNTLDGNIKYEYELDPSQYVTRRILTTYEYASVIGERASDIDNGCAPLVELDGEDTSIDIAKKEMDMAITPIRIKRYINEHYYELRSVNELSMPYQ